MSCAEEPGIAETIETYVPLIVGKRGIKWVSQKQNCSNCVFILVSFSYYWFMAFHKQAAGTLCIQVRGNTFPYVVLVIYATNFLPF